MAKQTVVTLIDDIDGSAAVESITFGIDGGTYEIDLNEKNAKKLRDVMASYVAHSRRGDGGARTSRAAGGNRRAAAKNTREELQAIRAWARKKGYEVSDRGRISQTILDAYNSGR